MCLSNSYELCLHRNDCFNRGTCDTCTINCDTHEVSSGKASIRFITQVYEVLCVCCTGDQEWSGTDTR